jgi:membrane protein DedA with SNARE-associated domain/rhodanese-related sulfurtransferase
MVAYLLLTTSAFGAQALLLPIVPLLVATGVLAAQGQLQPGWALLALVLGVACGDLLWYAVGRRTGTRVLGRVCRLTLEPDSCVRRTENLFGRHGARALLFAKFIPGLSTVALPLAGVFGMRVRRFVLYDAVGVFLWASVYLAAGYLSFQHVVPSGWRFSTPSLLHVLVGIAAIGAYFAWRYVRRRRGLREVCSDRITVDELKQRIDLGDPIALVDLRHPLELECNPQTLPGALHIPAEELRRRHREIPRRREVIVYCSCPGEATSASAALRLRARGFPRVRPLEGGYDAWRSRDLPLQPAGPEVPVDERTLNAA